MPSCEICREQQHKYKCPKCLLKYCSLPCFKTHKESGCAEITPKLKPDDRLRNNNSAEIIGETQTEDLVKNEVLRNLGKSSKLQAIMSNPHLQEILRNLDSTSQPQKVLEEAMKEPLFVEFADKALGLVEPQSQTAEA